MKKVLSTIFVAVGLMFGAGFASGKEIVVYFSRFGKISFLSITLASFLFCLTIYFFLVYGEKILKMFSKSKVFPFLLSFVSLAFSSSMFAGLRNLLSYSSIVLQILLEIFIVFLCLFVAKSGINFLGKLNFALMPILIILFVIVLFSGLGHGDFIDFSSACGLFYAPLYVSLNIVLGMTVLGVLGKELNKKQSFFVGLFSSLVLFFLLCLCNFVLCLHVDLFEQEMPILSLVEKNKPLFLFEFFVIFVGCLTTLLSLCFTSKTILEQIVKNENLGVYLAVFVPFLLSFVGFSSIISFFYPLCAMIGVFVLLISIFSFKKTDKKIHSISKDTQNRR